MLKEKHGTSNREVDILIVQSIAGHKIQIAVECRDKSRKDDITWIDAVIGKYADLEVNKIVAVSRSGFSQPAIEKAIEHKIETITLKQALRRDWPNEFIRLGICGISLKYTRLDRVRFEIVPELTEKLQISFLVNSNEGECTIGELIQFVFQQAVNKAIPEYLRQNNLLTLFKTKADLLKPFLIEQHTPITTDLHFIDSGGVHHKITGLTVRTISEFSVDDAHVDHHIFGIKKALISTAAVSSDNLGNLKKLEFIQIPGSNKIIGSIKPLNNAEARS